MCQNFDALIGYYYRAIAINIRLLTPLQPYDNRIKVYLMASFQMYSLMNCTNMRKRAPQKHLYFEAVTKVMGLPLLLFTLLNTFIIYGV